MALKDLILKKGDLIYVTKIKCPDCETKGWKVPYSNGIPPKTGCDTCRGSGRVKNPNPIQVYQT